MNRLADFLIRYPRFVVITVVLLSMGAAAYLGVYGIRFDHDIESFLPRGNPVIQEYRRFTEKYAPDDAFILLGFEDEDIFSYEVLRDLEVITDSLERLPDVTEVMSLSRAEGLVSSVETGLERRRLITTVSRDAEALARQRRTVLADSQTVGFLVNASGTATTLIVHFDTTANQFTGRAALIDGICRVVEPFNDRYFFHYSGIPYLRNAYIETTQEETVKYIFLASAIIVIVLVLMFRNVQSVILPMATIQLAMIGTIAFMMLAGSAIDVLTSTTAAIILVVGVADSIHLLAKYYDGLGRGQDRKAAVRTMVVRLGSATLLTSVTTAIGFATLATSVILPMQRFGIFTAAGVMIAFFISITLLSSGLLLMRAPRSPKKQNLAEPVHRAMLWVDQITARHPHAIVLIFAGILGLSIWGMSYLRVNAYAIDDMGPHTQVYKDVDFFQTRMAPPFPLEILITAPEPDAFKDPELLKRAAEIEAYLDNQPSIKRTNSVLDVLRRLNQALHADSTDYYTLPDDPELIAQYLFLLDLTDPDILPHLVSFDYSEIRISALMDDIGSYRLEPLLAELDSVMQATWPTGFETTRTGTIVLAASISSYMTQTLLVSIGLAFLFISILMGLLFRNVKLVVISLIPNILPLIITAGVMGMAGIDIKPATAVIFSIAFGIAVDDTIHVLARLRQELQRGLSMEDALSETLRGTGKAIVLTSLILFAGFFVLITSTFQSLAYMGALISLTILSALVADLFLLPALLHLLEIKDKPLISRQ